MSFPVLGPSERAFVEAVRELGYELAAEEGLRSVTINRACRVHDAADALLAAEPGCTCGEINARHCPAHNEPPAAPAPDAELERLLKDWCMREDLRAKIHAHVERIVQRREAAARGEVVGTGTLCVSDDVVMVALNRAGLIDFPADEEIPVTLYAALTRRAE